MSESDDLYVSPVVGTEQVDPSDSLTGDNTQDPLDAGWSPPDREPREWKGDTAEETREGESLDRRLAEEEPDIDPEYVGADSSRAGRLVAPDEGAHAAREHDEIASDVGRDGQAFAAEEAAVHIVDEQD